MNSIRLFTKKTIYFFFLASAHFSGCWTVKVINLTDEKVTINIQSNQYYPGLQSGRVVNRRCEFIDKQIEPHATSDFKYKDVNRICVAPCTKSVTITSPVNVVSNNPLPSCSNIVVMIRKDASNNWNIKYHDWTNDIAQMLAERTKMPLEVRNICDLFGDKEIQEIYAFRKPIGPSLLAKTLAKKELKELEYDNLYHTGLIIKCDNKFIKLHRIQTISSKTLKEKPENKNGFESTDIPLNKTITLNQFINNAMKNDPIFWKYDPTDNNCQLFVLQCLDRNNINVSDNLRAFIYQDINQIMAKNPQVKNFITKTISIANRLGNIVEGITRTTIQNGTPYTIQVTINYSQTSNIFKKRPSDDFLLESGKEKTINPDMALIKEIKVVSKGAGTSNIVAEKSFGEKAKLSANVLIRSVTGDSFSIENINLDSTELEDLATKTKANPALNLNLNR